MLYANDLKHPETEQESKKQVLIYSKTNFLNEC